MLTVEPKRRCPPSEREGGGGVWLNGTRRRILPSVGFVGRSGCRPRSDGNPSKKNGAKRMGPTASIVADALRMPNMQEGQLERTSSNCIQRWMKNKNQTKIGLLFAICFLFVFFFYLSLT